MCGIAGIAASDRTELAIALGRMAHRGPDARAELDLEDLALRLGHARLSILDLDPRSNQPFQSPCGRWALVFNGEIYNYLELQAELEAEGAHFGTSSDTEVLLQWMIRRGKQGLAALDGMFAFGLADRLERTLLLCRDAIGEKPLYYSLGSPGTGLRAAFASEVKGLLALRGIDTSLDTEALADYLRFLYTAAPRTLYRGIRELAPGHLLEISLDPSDAGPPAAPRAWYDLEHRVGALFEGSYEEAVEEFRALARQSLRLRLRSDVPVGFYLSGGLDSNCLLGLARACSPDQRFHTYTIRYRGSELSKDFDESEPAARAAAHQRAENLAVDFREESELLPAVERVVELFDQPFGNATAVVADQLAREAARRNKVCLVGDGGDELLAGYPRHRALPMHRRMSHLPSPLLRAIRSSALRLRERGRSATFVRRVRMFAEALEKPMAESFVDWSTYTDESEVNAALGRRGPTSFAQEMTSLFERHQHDPLRAAALVDFRSFVPFNLMQAADRTAMSHGLELRSPWLSTRLIEFSLRLPERFKLARPRPKQILLDAFGPGAPSEHAVIPAWLAGRKKKPFNPPMLSFVRRHLPELEAYLTRPAARIGTLISPTFLREELQAIRLGSKDNSTLLWGLATLECWLQRAGASPLSGRRLATSSGARLVGRQRSLS